MPRKKSLATIQEQRRKLEAIEKEIIGEMTAELGQGLLALFLKDPSNSLWQGNPQLLARLEELAAAKGKTVCSSTKLSKSSPGAIRNNQEIKSINSPSINHQIPHSHKARFISDVPDAEL
ncbi:MAG: hypothetical protein AB7F20_14920 [Geoalkalibacter sp.]|uniref:hypothetical protein n=1 Tax=Geoalkalibacter sp. TaxID=3041440 RepID=UPI003D0AE63A